MQIRSHASQFQVAILCADYARALNDRIDEWLEAHPNVFVIGIDYHYLGRGMTCSALIAYREGEKE